MPLTITCERGGYGTTFDCSKVGRLSPWWLFAVGDLPQNSSDRQRFT